MKHFTTEGPLTSDMTSDSSTRHPTSEQTTEMIATTQNEATTDTTLDMTTIHPTTDETTTVKSHSTESNKEATTVTVS